MAVQFRRGSYEDFDPTKMTPAEVAVITEKDPFTADGKAIYAAFAAGDVKRLATYEDMVENVEAASGGVVANEIDKQCAEAIQACETAADNADIATQETLNAAASAVNAASSANVAKSEAEEATEEAIAAAEAALVAAGGDVSEKTVSFTQASTRSNIATGETVGTLFGKIAKWLADLGTAAFKGVSNSLTTTADGYVLDARQGKALADRVKDLESDVTELKKVINTAIVATETETIEE